MEAAEAYDGEAAKLSTTLVAFQPTPLNADVVACCPFPGRSHILACGCYELDDKCSPPRRHGRLALVSVDEQAGRLAETSALEDVGVLDLAFLSRDTTPHLLAAATSACDARLYPVRESGVTLELSEACATMPCAEAGDSCMGLALSPDGGARIALSGTSGRVYVGALANDALRLENSWEAHDLEAWAVAFDTAAPHTLYTGADDAQLKVWDLREGHVYYTLQGHERATTSCGQRSGGN